MEFHENMITCKQLPLWPLLLMILIFGGVSLELGMLAAAVLSLIGLAAISRLPDSVQFTFTPESVTLKGWLGTIPVPATKTISRTDLIVSAHTQAGEDNHCVHTLHLSNARQSIHLSGLHCDPKSFTVLIERLKQPT